MGHFVANSLVQTLHTFSQMVMQFLPRLLAMLIIVVVGWVVAWLAKAILRRVLGLTRFNSLFVRAGVTQVLTKAALPTPSEMLARLVFWVLWITFILFGLEALQIPALQEEISGLFRVLPQIFVALVILFVGGLIANFASRATLLAAVNANSPSPRLISTVVRFRYHRPGGDHGPRKGGTRKRGRADRLFDLLWRHDVRPRAGFWARRPRLGQTTPGAPIFGGEKGRRPGDFPPLIRGIGK